MNIALSKDLETVIEQQVKRGSYSNAAEAVADAVRKTFCGPADLEQDSPELAQLLREALSSPHTPYKKGDLRRAVEKMRRQTAK